MALPHSNGSVATHETLKVLRPETGLLAHPGEDPGAEFFVVMEGKDEVWPPVAGECPV